MSTRSTTHFAYRLGAEPEAIIYRHADGYPEGAGKDIFRFLDEVGKLADTRFGDPSYLAAKYVVFLAREFAVSYDWDEDHKFVTKPNESPLDFISVGVLREDPGDIEYRYTIVGSEPLVYVNALDGNGDRLLADVLQEAEA